MLTREMAGDVDFRNNAQPSGVPLR
jgi:hypothetical protein